MGVCMKNLKLKSLLLGLMSVIVSAETVKIQSRSSLVCYLKSESEFYNFQLEDLGDEKGLINIIKGDKWFFNDIYFNENSFGSEYYTIDPDTNEKGLILHIPNNQIEKTYLTIGDFKESVNCSYLEKIEDLSFSSTNKDITLIKDFENVVTYKYQTAHFDFKTISYELQQNISDIGDWEDTYLSHKQENLVYKALKKEIPEFKNTLSRIKNTKGVKVMGLLFGRDWYWSSGRVSIVMSYKNELSLLTFEFDGNIRFGDPKLDYVY